MQDLFMAIMCLLALGYSLAQDLNVVITEGPGNVTRYIGQSVTFCCHYTGTRDLPLWKINGTLYVPTDLPYGHRFTFEGLQVKVRGQLNHTEYRCAVIVYREERFIKFLSPPALLTVLDTNTSTQADDELSCQMIDRPKIDTAGNDTAGNETAGNEIAGNETAGSETRMDVRSSGCDMNWHWSLIVCSIVLTLWQ